MGPRKVFNFKVKEIIGYVEHYNGNSGESSNDENIDSVDIYLSGGQVVTLDLTDDPLNGDELAKILGYNSDYWDTLYGKENPTNLCRSAMKSKVKSKSTYNPYE